MASSHTFVDTAANARNEQAESPGIPREVFGDRGRLFSDPDNSQILFTDFDVEAYTRAARGRIPIDRDAVAEQGLDSGVRDDLAFLWRLDAAALSEARAVLASWTSKEARITAFIATWAYERFWTARATRELMIATGDLPEPRAKQSVRAKLHEGYIERVMPMVVPVVTSIIGEASTGGQMAKLALQETSLQQAYRALLPRLDGEAARVVAEVADRRDEMIRFFALEASARVARSSREANLTRWQLLTGWHPLRVVGVPDPDERRALSSIFATPESRAALGQAQRAVRDLLRPSHAIPGAGPDGSAAPPATPGMLTRRNRHSV
ncbi:hypothetical protein [Nigerium massiliense]|uniref:hypothetical protein n=1 Tax=Nigerium massiliense TaxID=1522317 RepID=UPI00069339C5|nr:hypothetical protein [Nigerium massiliense]